MSITNVQIRIIVSGLIAAALLTTGVHAKRIDNCLAVDDLRQCGAISPLRLSMGDAYFNVEDTHSSAAGPADSARNSELLSRLTDTRFTGGWGHRVLCLGSASEVQARLQLISLEDIETRKTRYPGLESAISIAAYEYNEPSRRLAREMVTIPTHAEDLRRLEDKRLVSSSRHRQATRRGSYLKETIIDASIENDTIVIDQSVYVNGTLAQWHTWHLSE